MPRDAAPTEPDAAAVARQHAEGLRAVHALLARAGPAVASLSVEETERTEWRAELRDAALEVVFAAITRGEHDTGGPENVQRSTWLCARDPSGAIVATTRAEGWYGRGLLPALAEWSAATGRGVVWRRDGAVRARLDGRFPLLQPPGGRDLEAVCAELRAAGWSCAREGDRVVVARARRGRDWPMTLLAAVITLLLLPLMALVALLLAARRLQRGRWDVDPAVVQPWRAVEDRLELSFDHAALTLRRVQSGAMLFEHRWSPETLRAVFAEPGGVGATRLTVVERDRVRSFPLRLRGELRGVEEAGRAPALLAELAALRWPPR